MLFNTSGEEIVQLPFVQDTFGDTTGAGDSFDAGFLSAYLRRSPLAECLRIGNACGALSATRVGGTSGQPTETELQAFLRSNTATDPK